MAISEVTFHGANPAFVINMANFGFVLEAAKAGYIPVTNPDSLPGIHQYTKFTQISPNEIRFEYTDEQGNTRKGVVFRHQAPDAFAKVEHAKIVLDATNSALDSNNAQLAPKGWEPPKYADIEEIHLLGYEDDFHAVLIKVKGEDKPYLIVKEFDPDTYDALHSLAVARNDFRQAEADGYKLWTGQLPAYADIVQYIWSGDEIRFELHDGTKGYVNKLIDEKQYNAIAAYRDQMVATDDWISAWNTRSKPGDPGYITRAYTGNFYEIDYNSGKLKRSNEFVLPQRAWVQIEKIKYLDHDAVLITYYDSDKRTKVLGKQVVERATIGDEKFNWLLSESKHYERLSILAPDTESHPLTGQDRRARLWEEDKFPTFTKSQITLQMSTVDWVFDGFEDKGILIVRFHGDSIYSGQVIVFSEHKTPEAYATIRTYIKSGKNGAGGLIKPTKLDENSLKSWFGKDANGKYILDYFKEI